ncbi:unnamed protein product [Toxocara canis]|uniref:Uncharacterized protein n=1 Tax=Toxocara canis TaxID=6265 RepID=A0A3P7H278_TOXCA|nr:unnamed protein product [Toxocara canis]
MTGFRQDEFFAKYTNAKKEEEDESFCEELFDLMDEAEALFLDES